MGDDLSPQPSGEQKLRRSIKLPELVVYGLLFIAPTGLAGLFGSIYVLSEGALTTVYAVATVLMAFTAISYAQMSKALPVAGSVFSYARHGIGPRAGFIGGWMMLIDYVLIPSIAYLFAGLAMHSVVTGVPAWAWTLLFVVLTTSFNLAGVRFAARVGLVVAAAELLLVAVVAVLGLIVLLNSGPPHSWSLPITGENGLTFGVLTGAVSLAVFSFLGFDGVASFAEENAGSRRLVGRAMIICLVVAGLVLVTLGYVGAMITPAMPSELAADPGAQGTAFYDAIRETIAPWLAVGFAAIKALGSAFAAMVGQASASRLMFAMSREGTLPSVFTRLGRTSRVPVVATWALGALSLVVAVGASIMSNGLDMLSSVINVGALVGFLLVHCAVIGFYLVKRKTGNLWLHGVVPVIGGVVVLVLIASAATDAKIVGGIWLAAGIVVALVLRSRGRLTSVEPLDDEDDPADGRTVPADPGASAP